MGAKMTMDLNGWEDGAVSLFGPVPNSIKVADRRISERLRHQGLKPPKMVKIDIDRGIGDWNTEIAFHLATLSDAASMWMTDVIQVENDFPFRQAKLKMLRHLCDKAFLPHAIIPKFKEYFVYEVFRRFVEVIGGCDDYAALELPVLDGSPDLFQSYGRHGDISWIGNYVTFDLIPMCNICNVNNESDTSKSKLLRCAKHFALVRKGTEAAKRVAF